MTTRTARTLGLVAIAALIAGPVVGFLVGKEDRLRTHEGLNATLWMQTSEEYKMSVTQAFRLAGFMVERALEDPNWTAIPEQEKDAASLQKAAVILDIDETFLDNSAFQGQIILDDTEFHPSMLRDWQRTGQPALLPGAGAFIRGLQERNVDVFYITNRSRENRETTLRILDQLYKLPVTDQGGNLLDRPPADGSDKQSRRELVIKTHRVLLLIGDDLNDFVSGGVSGKTATLQSRAKTAEAHRDFWGTRWIIVPNPAFGSWERALYGFDGSLSRQDILKAKYEALKGR